ncbi:MAG: HDOD domain-containing protein [Lachnospiraceae bacterium]|nr:HDOD domain-containing protein [Lachnospiraceae bacterium]
MLAALIPLFDDTMTVCAYSIFAQKENLLLNPALAGSARFDGAVNVPGLDIVNNMGITTLSGDKEVFIEMNNISIFADLSQQCPTTAPEKLVLLVDNSVTPDEQYVKRLKELKDIGYKLAIRKLTIDKFEPYKSILLLMDYIFLDHKKIVIEKAKIYFGKVYPNIKLCAVNVNSQEDYDNLTQGGGYNLYEGEFFRLPANKGDLEVAPVKVNYIELLNVVNDVDFDLTQAADVIGRDTALVISLLEMVNRMTVNSGISSVRHAAAMLGQKELKKWINTAVTKELCADKPSEITRLSLVRAKFAENLAPVFEQAGQASELFLMGLFSVLDVILDKTMEEALEMVKVSKPISDALLNGKGNLAPVLEFIRQYENASWQEVSRLMVLSEIDMDDVYNAYLRSLTWYKDLFDVKVK